MKKEATNTPIGINHNKSTESRKNFPVKKNTRYIYTEADLGEGILYVGMTSSHISYKQENSDPQNNYSWSYAFL